MNTIDAILFDLDGTLVGFDDAVHKQAMTTVCNTLGATYGLDGEELNRKHWELSVQIWRAASGGGVFRAANGAVDGRSLMLDVWQQALTALGCSDPEAGEAGVEAYWVHRNAVYYCYDEVVEVLDVLRGKVQLGVVTNGPMDTQLDKLQASGLEPYFDVVIASGGAGIAKPDPEIFHLALNKLGAAAAKSWHVGDHLGADVGGAIAAGMRAAWVNRTGAVRAEEQAAPHAEGSTLRELLPQLGF